MNFKIPRYKLIFALSDLIIILISLLSALYLTYLLKDSSIEKFVSQSTDVVVVFLIVSIIFVFIFQSNNLYKINVFLTHALHLASIVKSLFYGAISVIIIGYLFKYPFLLDSRLFIIFFTVDSLLLFLIFRVWILRYIFLNFSKHRTKKRKVIIVGAGQAGKSITSKMMIEQGLGIVITGFVDDAKEIGEEVIAGKKVLGSVGELSRVINEYKIEEIIIAIDNISYERLLEIIDIAKRYDVFVKMTSELFDVVPQKISTEQYSGIPVVNVSPQMPIEMNFILKRISDFTGAIIGILLLSPAFIVISILVKLSSPGPVFFAQERIGKNGKKFKFYKFRSMKISKDNDAERQKMMLEFIKNGQNQNGNDTKIINESRVTWIGKIIRKTSLDELPQLFNVILGDMSLVGPRPSLPYEYDAYDKWQKRRTSVLPGCTGVWQVFGRSNVSFKDSIVLDLYYINNMSPWLDLQLIIKTIPVMLFSKGGK